MVFFTSLFYTSFMLYKNYKSDILAELYFYTGIFAMIFTAFSLLLSLFKFKGCKKLPRLFGIFAFMWAFLHLSSYFIFSKQLSFSKLFNSIFTYNIEFSGFISFMLMSLMLLASFSLFKSIKIVLKMGYVLFVLICIHYFLSAKIPNLWHISILFLSIFLLYLRYKNDLINKIYKQGNK